MKSFRVVLILVLLAVSKPVFADLKIGFWSNRDAGGRSLFVMNPDGSSPVNLSKPFGIPAGGTWSPDKTKIAFDSERTGNWEIFVINADGSNLVNLSNDPGTDQRPRWSPDGTQILWTKSPPRHIGGSRDIFVMDADGSNKRNLGKGYYHGWSPDATQIAFSLPINAGPNANFADIHVMNADGTDRRRVSNAVTSDYFRSWSPDGTKIAFQGINDWRGHRHVYVVNIDGSNLVDLTKDFSTG